MRMRVGGFTLIEIMMVVVIIAILAAFAYPSYQNSVIKSRRADGITMINQVLQAQERYFTGNLTYVADLQVLGYSNTSNVPSQDGYYLVTATACGGGIDECVLVTAAPQGQQASDGNLSLNSQGSKTGSW